MICEKFEKLTDSQKALWVLGIAAVMGAFCIAFYAFNIAPTGGALAMTSIGVMYAGASTFVGGALGFLFGIPRTFQQEGNSKPADNPSGNPDTSRSNYRPNTNLEQISDWLTKILVGVTLTQIPEIRGYLVSLTKFAAKGLGSQPSAEVFALAILLYSSVLGFLFGYLWTRLFLTGALIAADQKALEEKVETTAREFDAFKKQADIDSTALITAEHQLNPRPDLTDPPQDQLNAAIDAASYPVKVQIFNRAWQIRAENWRDNKPKMERTIPLFRALIYCDKDNRYHMNHGQLGFALKDKTSPDWAEAEKELTAAINIRGPGGGWLFYEFNRAYCRIKQDSSYKQDQASTAELKAAILDDLAAAWQSSDIRNVIENDMEVRKWMQLNNVSLK